MLQFIYLLDHTADAPEIISHSSIVILACLALLQSRVSASRISPAFLEAFSMAFMRELCSEAMLFSRAWQTVLDTQNSQKNSEVGPISESSGSCFTTYLKVLRNSLRVMMSTFLWNCVITFLNSLYRIVILSHSLALASTCAPMAAAVGKFIGVITLVIAFSRMSGKGLERATDPLSPTTKILKEERSPALTMALTSLTMLELVPPQRPLSVVRGTRRVFLTDTGVFFLCRQVSLAMILETEPTPKVLALSRRETSCFILEAATIFMALVIFLMDSTAFMRSLMSFKLLVAKAKLDWKMRGVSAWVLLMNMLIN